MNVPPILYHCASNKLAKKYRLSGCIQAPVRGFDSLMGAMAWCIKVGRTVIYEIRSIPDTTYKLPDHHNQFGSAWWIDANVENFKCVFSAEKDA
jgi:hypothetical protein